MRNAGPVSPSDPPGSRTKVGSKRLARSRGPSRQPHEGAGLAGPLIVPAGCGSDGSATSGGARGGLSVGREPPHAPAREIVQRAPVPPLLDHGGAHVGRAGDRRGVAELLSDTAHHGGEDPPLVGRCLGKPAVGKAARCAEERAAQVRKSFAVNPSPRCSPMYSLSRGAVRFVGAPSRSSRSRRAPPS